jgi:hypothetical protein
MLMAETYSEIVVEDKLMLGSLKCCVCSENRKQISRTQIFE